MSMNVGFIGLGIMGAGMARNVLKAGLNLTVWNRTESKMQPLIDEGAKGAGSPHELAADCNVLVLCLSDTPDVEAVLFGEQGVAGSLPAGSVVVDCSTISPIETQRFAQMLSERGIAMLDAPVSGGSEGAAKGTLSIMVGGEPDAVDRARPVLEAMGRTITHVGASGAGQMVKLVNQVLVTVGMLALGEAFLFAEAGGLDLEKTLKAVEGGAAGSWTLSNRGPQLIKRDWRPGFTIDLQQKDLRLILETARSLKVPMLGAGMVSQLYTAVQQQGGGGDGNHALVKALEQLSGIEVAARQA